VGTFWGWIRKTARLWGFLAFVALILFIFRSVILPFVLAVLVTYVLSPVLRFLCQGVEIRGRRLPRFVWVIALYAVLLGMMGLFVTSFVPRLSNDFKRIVKEAPSFWNRVRQQYVPAVSRWAEENLGGSFNTEPRREPTPPAEPPRLRVRPTANAGELEVEMKDLRLEVVQADKGRWVLRVPAPTAAKPEGGGLIESINNYLNRAVVQSETRMRQVMGLGQKLVLFLLNTITTFILVLMISAFLLVDTERILRWFRGLVPEPHFDDFDNVIVLIDKGLSGAIRGQLIICVINGVLTWIGLVLIGVKYALLLGLLAGVMSLIPIFGSILSSFPIVIVALASGESGVDLLKGFLVLAWIIGIHLLEANLLNPKIMGTAAKIHPVVVIFAVVAGERTYGPIGALLGVPLVSAVQAVFMYVRRKQRAQQDMPTERKEGA
jgi:predicted PurR-regulated permease PerM